MNCNLLQVYKEINNDLLTNEYSSDEKKCF